MPQLLLPPITKLSTEPLPYPVAYGQQVYNTDTGTWQVYELDANGLSATWNTFADTLPDGFLTNAMIADGAVNFAKLAADTSFRAQFEETLLAIFGATPLLWLPISTDTTTSTGKSRSAKTITHAVSLAARQSALGLGVEVSFDAVNDYATTPDSADLSPGNGTSDTAFSLIALGKVNGDANNKTILAKYGGTSREWLFDFDANEKLRLTLYDESADKSPIVTSTSARATGANKLWVATYSAATGGDTAENDIALYENGLVIASSGSGAATGYVAMEDTTQTVGIGATSGNGSKFNGSLALVAYVAKALSADEVWRLYKACEAYFAFL